MENSMQGVEHLFTELHFRYLEQFIAALVPMIVTVILHGQGMRLASKCFSRFGRRRAGRAHDGPHVIVLIAIVAIMLGTHFVEVAAWAVFYSAAGMLPDAITAMYVSINSYTTLGASNITLPGKWKGVDGFEAMTAMLMFGWSTAVLAAVVQQAHSIDD